MTEPETLMEMIDREMERKISVRLDHLLEEFSEKLEVQRRKLVEDFVGFGNFTSSGFNIFLFRISIFGIS